ncbi:hypothetical protein HHI36_005144, partial [Cryptolaemus montrouzieri]
MDFKKLELISRKIRYFNESIETIVITKFSRFSPLALSKLDSNTQRLFEMTLVGNEISSYEKLVAFIKQQAKILERTSPGTSANAAYNTNP